MSETKRLCSALGIIGEVLEQGFISALLLASRLSISISEAKRLINILIVMGVIKEEVSECNCAKCFLAKVCGYRGSIHHTKNLEYKLYRVDKARLQKLLSKCKALQG